MRVGVIGMGYVGRAVASVLAAHLDIVSYDVSLDEEYPVEALHDCAAAVVCVDTPEGLGGHCDIRNVVSAVTQLPVRHVILKSTVAPGTTDALVLRTGKNVCYWPEFIGESTAYDHVWGADLESIPFVIVGGSSEAREMFMEVMSPTFGPEKVYFQCGAVEAELIKYMENAYLAAKVTFVNEFRNIAHSVGADWYTVREGWLLDPRMGRSHTWVAPGRVGFDGKCLPKDLRAIIECARSAGYDPAFLAEVFESNVRVRRADGCVQ